MAKAVLDPEHPDGPYLLIFESDEERKDWEAAQAEKQKAYRRKRRRWMKSIGWPWPSRASDIDDHPAPGTVDSDEEDLDG